MSTEWENARHWRLDCQSVWGVPKTIDLWDLVRNQRVIKGAFPVSSLKRLVQGLPDQTVVRNVDSVPENDEGVVWFELAGQSRVGERASVALSVQARVLVICQRCLEPMVQDLVEEVTFDVVTHAQLDSLDNEEVDPDETEMVVGSRQFDLPELLEDQLILAIPYVPKHAQCRPKAIAKSEQADQVDEAVQKPNPFEVLAKLKGRQ